MQIPPSLDPVHVAAWAEHLCVSGVDAVSLYVWQPDRTMAVIGLAQDPAVELKLQVLAADGVSFLRRASGGGAVVLGPGVLCFGVVAPPAALGTAGGIRAAFRALTHPVLRALADAGLQARLAGISDIAVADRSTGRLHKVAGCAQLRKRRSVLVHGSLLVQLDTALFERYLRLPAEAPAYRLGRSHTDFCRSLFQLLDPAPNVAEMAGRLASAAAQAGWRRLVVPQRLSAEADTLFCGKYACDAWNRFRRRPEAGCGT